MQWSDNLQPGTVTIASSSTIYVTYTISKTNTFVTVSCTDSKTTRSVSSNPSEIKMVGLINPFAPNDVYWCICVDLLEISNRIFSFFFQFR